MKLGEVRCGKVSNLSKVRNFINVNKGSKRSNVSKVSNVSEVRCGKVM